MGKGSISLDEISFTINFKYSLESEYHLEVICMKPIRLVLSQKSPINELGFFATVTSTRPPRSARTMMCGWRISTTKTPINSSSPASRARLSPITPKKRTVIEFDIAGSGIPSTANVINAQMQLYYYSAMRPTGSTDPWIDRWIQAHQLLVDWDEAQATKVKRLTSTNWNADWGAIDGTDADSTMESTVLFQEGETGTWKSWNLTNVTQDWVDGSATNYGVILWATNEDTDGYEMRFRSSEYSSNQPKLEVTYTEDPLKTVFFLKDHLGSIRATVEEDGDVAGYTDYDPWGYLLANRVLETAWSGQNVAQNKFTGKEWDDDFGLGVELFRGAVL